MNIRELFTWLFRSDTSSKLSDDDKEIVQRMLDQSGEVVINTTE